MCGIYAVWSQEENAAGQIAEGLRRLEYRGYDSWGIGLVDIKEQVWLTKQVGAFSQITNLRKWPRANLGIGHTRWATHGGVTQANAHPHTDCHNRWLVVHNGVIENATKLKEGLGSKHQWRSQTDTEVVAHLLEGEEDRFDLTAFGKIVAKLKGSNALVALDKQTQTLYGFSSGSPLLLGDGNEAWVIASDERAMVGVRQVTNLAQGQMVQINRLGVTVFDQGKPLVWRIPVKVESRRQIRGPKLKAEIEEQPGKLTALINTITDFETDIKAWNRVESRAYVACGSASYAALTATYWGSGKQQTVTGGEFNRLSLNYTGLMAISQSGETMDTLLAVKGAKQKNIPVWALVNNTHSSLSRLADKVLPLSVGWEEAVAATKSYSSMVAWLWWINHSQLSRAIKSKALGAVSQEVAKIIESPNSNHLIEMVTKKLTKTEHVYILGKGPAYPTALEAALKLKEITYTYAEGIAGGEIKHGMLALITKNTPVIVIETEAGGDGDLLASEVSARGAWVIGISDTACENYDVWLPLPKISYLREIPAVVWIQLIALRLALTKGIDPDRPRNLAKSVTVK